MTALHAIVHPNYNEAKDLAKTLDSILNQTFKDFEVILVDDASTDGSQKIIADYARKDSRIRPFYQKQNAGVFQTVNFALSQVRSPYLSYTASGEILYPSYLERAHQYFSRFTEAKIWACHLDLFYKGEQINSRDPNQFVTPTGEFFLKDTICQTFRQSAGFRMHGMAVVLDTKTFFDYGGGYPFDIGPSADFYVHHKIALNEGLAYCPEYLGALKVHDDSFSRKIYLDRKKRNLYYFKLIDHLYEREEPQTRLKFLQSGLFTSTSDTLFWKLLAKPKYWSLLKYSKSSTSRRIFRSLLKKAKLVKSSRT